jgi:histone-binding protein RBBP4
MTSVDNGADGVAANNPTEEDEKVIQAEYMQWRKNVQYLYDTVLNHGLDWPAMSVQWFSDYMRNNNETTQRLLVSTHTSGQEAEYLQILSVTFPDMITEDVDEPGQHFTDSKFRALQKIPVQEEVNRAKYNPLAPNLIAARSDSEDVCLYDYTKHLSKSTEPNPDLILKGHERGGYGLDWSRTDTNILISSGEDGLICYFDINKIAMEKKTVVCARKYAKHTSVVNDVCFNCYNSNVFASVGDDRSLIIWDRRVESESVVERAHNLDILTVEFNPLEEFILATGSADATVKVWDMRYLEKPLYTLAWHAKAVNQVRWSMHMSSVLASASMDRRICIWDVARAGMEMSKEDLLDGPPELLFVHGGHTNAVTDLCWNPLEKWEIASVAEDNILQIWARAVPEEA